MVGRYLLFVCHQYEPEGGWHDFRGSFVTLESARSWARHDMHHSNWYHIVDSEAEEIVEEGRRNDLQS